MTLWCYRAAAAETRPPRNLANEHISRRTTSAIRCTARRHTASRHRTAISHRMHRGCSDHKSSPRLFQQIGGRLQFSNISCRNTVPKQPYWVFVLRHTHKCKERLWHVFVLQWKHFYPRGASDARAIAMIACPCLCVTRRYCIKTAKRRITHTTPRDSPRTLVFWRQNSLVDDTHSPWKLRSKWPIPFQTAQFRPIFAHSASTVGVGLAKKVQFALIWSRSRASQRA